MSHKFIIILLQCIFKVRIELTMKEFLFSFLFYYQIGLVLNRTQLRDPMTVNKR